MNTTFQDFLDAGFYEYTSSIHKGDRQCQLRVRGPDGRTLYFINVSLWKFPELDKIHQNQIECEAHLYTGSNWFEIKLFQCDNRPVKQILDFFADIYNKMDCIPDIHNN